MNWREKHAEKLQEIKRLQDELAHEKEIVEHYALSVDGLHEFITELYDENDEVRSDNERGARLHECYKDEMWVQYVEACETEYALERSRRLCKRLEWYIRGTPPENEETASRRYNEIIAAINEQS
jgi:beta-xylosidase